MVVTTSKKARPAKLLTRKKGRVLHKVYKEAKNNTASLCRIITLNKEGGRVPTI